MLKKMDREKWISAICIVALILVTAPLLILGFYSYPSADDWTHGLWTHQAVEAGEGFWGVMKASLRTVLYWRENGEPRHANSGLGSLQPGIWGEQYYWITSWIMIGSIIVGEYLLCRTLLGKDNKESKKWLWPMLVPTLCFQLLFVPYPEETFYWYVGGINYTFVFSLSLLLTVLFMKMAEDEIPTWKLVLYELLGIIMTVLVGGNNYTSSLSTTCLLICGSVYYLIYNKKAFWRSLPFTLGMIANLLLCVMAPTNQVRLDVSFGGETGDPLLAVWMSITRTAVNIYSWTTLKIILMVIFTIPFLWMALKNSKFSFKRPWLFTIFTFGIYATQITANMYVEGGISACRISDILYYAYHVWLLLNVGYWVGWLQRRKKFETIELQKYGLRWFLTAGAVLFLFVGLTEIKHSSTYRACVWLVQGKAVEYQAIWEERLSLLKDETVKEVEVTPIQGGADMIKYADFSEENQWFSDVCAEYYGKDEIRIRK